MDLVIKKKITKKCHDSLREFERNNNIVNENIVEVSNNVYRYNQDLYANTVTSYYVSLFDNVNDRKNIINCFLNYNKAEREENYIDLKINLIESIRKNDKGIKRKYLLEDIQLFNKYQYSDLVFVSEIQKNFIENIVNSDGLDYSELCKTISKALKSNESCIKNIKTIFGIVLDNYKFVVGNKKQFAEKACENDEDWDIYNEYLGECNKKIREIQQSGFDKILENCSKRVFKECLILAGELYIVRRDKVDSGIIKELLDLYLVPIRTRYICFGMSESRLKKPKMTLTLAMVKKLNDEFKNINDQNIKTLYYENNYHTIEEWKQYIDLNYHGNINEVVSRVFNEEVYQLIENIIILYLTSEILAEFEDISRLILSESNKEILKSECIKYWKNNPLAVLFIIISCLSSLPGRTFWKNNTNINKNVIKKESIEEAPGIESLEYDLKSNVFVFRKSISQNYPEEIQELLNDNFMYAISVWLSSVCLNILPDEMIGKIDQGLYEPNTYVFNHKSIISFIQENKISELNLEDVIVIGDYFKNDKSERERLKAISTDIIELSKNVIPESKNYFFWGKSGSGKTELAKQIAKKINKINETIIIKLSDISSLDELNSQLKQIDSINGIRAVILDEFDKALSKEFYDRLFGYLDRYNTKTDIKISFICTASTEESAKNCISEIKQKYECKEIRDIFNRFNNGRGIITLPNPEFQDIMFVAIKQIKDALKKEKDKKIKYITPDTLFYLSIYPETINLDSKEGVFHQIKHEVQFAITKINEEKEVLALSDFKVENIKLDDKVKNEMKMLKSLESIDITKFFKD